MDAICKKIQESETMRDAMRAYIEAIDDLDRIERWARDMDERVDDFLRPLIGPGYLTISQIGYLDDLYDESDKYQQIESYLDDGIEFEINWEGYYDEGYMDFIVRVLPDAFDTKSWTIDTTIFEEGGEYRITNKCVMQDHRP